MTPYPSGPIPVAVVYPTQRNAITEGDGFYVSHNDFDITIYGGETTALVFGQMQAFYILDGDHREAYSVLIPQGFEACLAYYAANFAQANRHSDRLPVAV